MLEILAITGPIYLVVLAGYAATRFGLFARTDMQVFGKFVFNLALPALIFNALSQRHISDILHPAYLLSYLGGSLLVLALAFQAGRRALGLGVTRSTFLAMGMCCSNSSFIGFPILMLMVAPVAGVALGMNVLIENLIMLPLLLAMAEHGRDGGGGTWPQLLRQSAQRLMRNPLVLAVVAGMAVSLSELALPQPVLRTVDLFARASGGLSLFAIGGMLVGLSLSSGWQRVVPQVAGKLIGHPLAVLLIAALLPLVGVAPMEPQLRAAALLMAAMPMLSIYPIIGQAYGEADRAATALLICMVTSFFTLSGWMWLLH
ncbi:AEC family transporter [Duganella sp. FT80W]|uniref:AEC family transporter n=1 Tax=Duganella guangzhouensis TaxID=2666084 RepID=A0A6I2LB41_9BURK|nr:AEC family transporter [Duganella guangzhouensis]MRW93489.1 AEC family transporter [Duganella guangzhouensis]